MSWDHKLERTVNSILEFFASRKVLMGSLILCVVGQVLDQVTTQININFLGCYEANPYIAPIVSSPIIIIAEIGFFSIVWLIPYTLMKLTKYVRPFAIMGYIFGLVRMGAAFHNILLMLSI